MFGVVDIQSHDFVCCNQQNETVHAVLQNGAVNLTFNRTFGSVEIGEWQELCRWMERVVLNENEDKVNWDLKRNGRFSTKSMYRLILLIVLFLLCCSGGC
jgi:hypothetical protein